MNPLRLRYLVWFSALILLAASCGKVSNPDAASSESISAGSGNTAPVISVIADQTIEEDTPDGTGALSFSISDSETAASSLTVSTATSNTDLVPSANIVLGGSGEERTISITPAANQNGTAIISILVSDGTNTTTSTFNLTVTAVNDAPTIDAITTKYTQSTETVTVSVDDIDNEASELTISAVSSNQTLLPNANISVSGTTITMTIVGGESGSTTVTVTVSDGTDSASTSFQLVTDPCTSSIGGSLLDSSTYGDSGCGQANDDFIVASGTTVVWDGTGGPLTGTIKVEGILQITGAGGDLQGAIELAGGTLQVDEGVTVSGDFTQSGNTTIDIASGKTLSYGGAALSIGSNTLTISGDGTLDNTPSGTLTLNNSSSVLNVTGNSTISGAAKLAGGTLNIDGDVTLSNNIIYSDSSAIDIASGKTLDYNGVSLTLGSNTLTLSGGGTLNNANQIVLDQAASTLKLTTAGTTIAGNIEMNTSSTLDVDADCTIGGNITFNSTPIFNIADGTTLTYSGTAIDLNGHSLTLASDGSGTFAGSLEIDGGIVSATGNITVTGTLTHNSATATTISVSSGKTLTYGGAGFTIDASTLTFSGGGTFANTNAIELDNAASVLTLDTGSGTIAAVTVSGAGATINTNADNTISTLTLGVNTTMASSGSNTLSVGTLNQTAGTVTLGNRMLIASGTVNDSFVLNGGTLAVSGDITIGGTISMNASSGIEVASGKTITYGGAAIDIGARTLTLSGGGTFGTAAINLNDASSVLKAENNGATISSAINLSVAGASLNIDANTTVSGAITQTASSSINLAAGTALTYSNVAAIDFGATTMTLAGTGALANTGTLNLNNGSSNLTISDELSISGPVALAGGTLNVDASTDISGAITHTAASTIDIAASKTLNYTGAAVTMGASVLDLPGTGVLANTNAFSVETGATLQLDGAGTITGPIILNDGTLAINANATISGNMTHTAASTINVAGGSTLTYSGAGIAVGAFTLNLPGTGTMANTAALSIDTGSTLLLDGAGTITGPVILNGGTLDVTASAVISGDMTHTASSTVDVAGGITLSYSGAAISIGAFTLNLSGTGTVANTNAFSVGTGATLQLTGAGTVSGPVILNDGTLDVNASATISGNITHTASSTVDVAGGSVLTYSGAAVAIGAYTLDIQNTGTVTNTNAFSVDTGSTLQLAGAATINGPIILNDGTLDVNAAATINGLITHSASSTIDIANGITLAYANAGGITIGAYTLDLPGQGTLNNSGGALNLNNASSVLQLDGSGATVSGAVTLGGGTVTANESASINGNISQSASSTINVASSKTLTYGGGAISFAATTLTLPGAGEIANTGAFNLNNASAILKIDGAGSISGPVTLAGGTLDVNESSSISGALSHTASSSIDVASGKTLSYSGGAFNVGAFTLTIPGTGTIANSGNAITLNDNDATLTLTGSGGTTSAVTVSTDQIGGQFNVNADYTITTLTAGANARIQSSAAYTLSATTLTTTAGDLVLYSKILASGGSVAGNIDLQGGTFAVNADLSVSGTISHSASSTIDVVGSTTTLTYANAADINIGAFTLTLPGAGKIDNSGGAGTINLNNASSVIQIDGSGSEIMGPVDLGGGTLDVNQNTTISGNLSHSASSIINIADGMTLTYSGGTVGIGAFTLDLQSAGTGTIANTGAFSVDTGSTLKITNPYTITGPVILNDGTLEVDAAATISGNITHTASSTINVANGITLTYSGSAINIGAFTLDLQSGGTGSIANTSAFTLGAGATLQVVNPYTISGPVILNGGSLTVDAATTISGDITHTASSVVNVADTVTLTYSGAAVSVGAFTLALQSGGTGTITNTNAFTVGSGATLQVVNPYTINGPIALAGGTFDVNVATTVTGAITHTASSTLDINGVTLTYSGSAISLGAYTLTLPGTGTIANTNAITLNSGSSILKIDGSGSEITGPVTLAGGTLDINQNTTISGAITHTASSGIDVFGGMTLTYSNAATLDIGGFTLTLAGTGTIANTAAINLNDNFAILKIDGSGSVISGPVILGGGTLDVNQDTTISGVVTHTGSSSISVAGTMTFTYSNAAAVNLGAYTLDFSEAGTIANTGAITLNDSSSVLQMDGSGSKITGPVVLAGGKLDVNQSSEISGAITHTGSSTIDVAGTMTFTYSNASAIDVGAYTLDLPGTGTLNNSAAAINLNDASSILRNDGSGTTISGDVILAGGTLLLNESATINGAITHTASSIINVAGTKTLTYTGAAIDIGVLTLDLDGDGTIANSNALNLSAAGSTLKIDGAATITGDVILNGGTLDVNDNTSISGDITHTASSTIDVVTGKTLTYSGATVSVGALTLTVPGSGTISNAGSAITMNDAAATLTMTGSGGTISAVTVTVSQVGGQFNTNADYTITTLTAGANARIQSSGAFTLSTPTLTTTAGDLVLYSKILASGGSVAGNVDLQGGTFATDADLTVSGTISHSAASTIDIGSGTTLTYSNATTIGIGALTLTMPGSGTFANTGILDINAATATLNITGAATISGPIDLDDGILDIDEDVTISGAITHSTASTINVADGKTLTYSGAAIDLNGLTLDLQSTGTGAIANTNAFILSTGSTLQVVNAYTISGPVNLNDGTLEIDENTTISGNITHSAASTISIADTKTLTYSGAAISVGALTLDLQSTGTGTLANTNAITLGSGATLQVVNAHTISGPVILNGGTLQIDAATTISGNLTHTASSTITVADGITLTYSGAAVDVGALTLALQSGGTGTLANTNAITLGTGATLQVASAFNITGPVILNDGTLDVNAATTISGDMTHTASSTIDIAGVTLTYTGAAVSVGAFTLDMPGTGTLANSNALTLGSGSTLNITGASTISGPVILNGGTLDVDAATTISGNITHTASSTIDVNGVTLTYSGAAVNLGAYTLTLPGTGTIANTPALVLNDASSVLKVDGAVTDISGPITLNGGTLDINETSAISGDISLSTSSTIDVASGKTLTYSGASIAVGSNTLSIPGAGAISNAGSAITLDDAVATLTLAGSGGNISAVTVSTDQTSGRINVNANYAITTLTVNQDTKIQSSGSYTLTNGTLTSAGASNLTLYSKILVSAGTVNGNIVLSGGTFAIDAALTVAGNISLSNSSTLDISGTTLTYTGAAITIGTYILDLPGAGTFDNSGGGALSLNNAAGTLQIDGITTISGDMALGGGTLLVNANTTVSGNITQSASSTVNLAATLDYNGANISFGATTMTLMGTGTFDNSGGATLNLNNASAVLKIDGAATVSGPVVLALGTLDVNESSSITGDITHTASSTIDVLSGKTLTYGGAAVDIGAFTLTISGSGIISNAGSALNLNDNAATLTLTGSGGSISAVNVSTDQTTGRINTNADYTITTLSQTANAYVQSSASYTLTVGTLNSNAAQNLTLDSRILVSAGTLNGNVILNGGTFAANANLTIAGTISHTASSSIEVVGSSTTLTYSNATAIGIGAFTLTMPGAGTFANTGILDVNAATATLNITGEGTISGPVDLDDGILDVDANAAISGNITHSTASTIQVANGKTLTYSGAAIDVNGLTLDLQSDGTGTIANTNAITVSAGSTLQTANSFSITGPVDLNGGTLQVDAATAISGNLTHTAGSVINVADTVTLTYSGAAVSIGAFTLTLQSGGTGTIANTNAFTLGAGATLQVANPFSITGPVALDGGTLEINAATTISGDMTHTAASIINVADTITLTYSGAAVSIGAFTLTLQSGGTGTIANTNAFTLGSGSTLQAAAAYNISGPIVLNGGTLDINAATAVSGNITHTASSVIDIADTITLTYSGAAVSIGAFTLDLQSGGTGTFASTNAFSLGSGSTLQISNAYTISGPVILNGGTLDVKAATTVSGSITHTASSTVNVDDTITLTYSGAAIDIGAYTLALQSTGTGTIANTNAFSLGTGATLQIASPYTISGPIILNDGTLDINAATTISGDITHTASSTIDVAGVTLTYSGAAIAVGAYTLDLPGTGTIANTNAINLNDASAVLKIDGAVTDISGSIILGGGSLDVNEDATISGDISHGASSTIDIASSKTLIYSGAAIDIGAFTLDLTGAGTITNTNALNLNNASAKVQIDGAATISGPVILAGGTLDVNENATISGAVTHTASSSVDIASAKTLTYSNGAAISLGAFTLTMPGTGTLANTGALNLNNASSELQIDGSGSTISGPVTLGGGILDVNVDTTISGLLSMSADVDLAIASSKTLSYTNATALSIGGGVILTFSETGSFGGNLQLNGGTLNVDDDTILTSAGTLTQTLASTIDIAAGKELSYAGSTLNIGAMDLTLTGAAGCTFNVTDDLTLDNVSSRLLLNGSGTVNKVKVSAAASVGRGIVVNGGDFVITDLTLDASPRINIASGTLTVGNNLTVNATAEMTVSGAGTLTLHDIVLSASLDIDGTVSLADDATLYVLADATFGSGNDLTFKDGLQVSDTADLTIADTDGTFTLTFQGGITVNGSGTVVLSDDESLVLEYPAPDSTTLAKFTDSSSGTLTPTYVEPITSFAATAGDTEITLNWTNPASADVLIRRSTTGYPTSTTSGAQVYDSNGTSYTDTGLSNGVTYYYTAFTHTTTTNYTSGSNAEQTPYTGTPFSMDVTSFTATVGDGQVSLSWDNTAAVAAGATGVVIRRSTSGYPASESAGELVYDGTGTSTVDRGQSNSSGYKGVKNGTVYYYRAFAYDASDYAVGVNAMAAAASHSSGLTAYYPFSGNESDGSGQGNHGTLVGATLTTDKNNSSNQAYYFNPDDGNDYIDINSPVDENFTISFWMQTTQAAGAQTDWRSTPGLISAYVGADQNDFGVGIANGQVLFGTGTGGSPEVSILSPSSSYNDGNWYHVTAVRTKATGSLKIYIQGQQVVSGTGSTNTLNAPATMRFGGFPDDTNFFKGKIDDVRIYNRVLNLTEIQDLYLSGAATREFLLSTSDSSGSSHTCVLLSVASGYNNIKCWGDANANGYLGDGGVSTGATASPVEVSSISTAVQISAGLNHNCAVLSDDTIKCWGEGANGKLGNGSTSDQTNPVAVSSIIDAWQVAAGGDHSCALLDNGFSGTIKCWGDASSGQLGNGVSTGSYSTPQLVTGISTAVQVDTGYNFSCALLADGTAQCWGNGTNGKLGNGATATQNTPVPVSSLSGAVQLSLGYAHACAVINDGTIKCWGDGTNARMGDGFTNTTNSTPTSVSGITTAVQVSAGYAHTCALLADGTMKCWGLNGVGQLGDGTTTTQNSPVAVSGISSATGISVGGDTTCAIISDGTVKCWGEGSLGELGDGTTADDSTPGTASNLNNSARQP